VHVIASDYVASSGDDMCDTNLRYEKSSTCVCAMPHVSMSHVTHMISHVTHMNESCHTYE